jgi:tetratricopeptide (TPR) repeat protein
VESESDLRSQTERGRRIGDGAVAGVLLVLVIGFAVLCWRTAPTRGPSGPLSVDTGSPYRNTRAGVKYVGDASCVRCHAEIGESYRSHPMGRSLSPITPATAAIAEKTAGAALFEADGLQYSIENRGGHVIHLETRRAPSGAIVAKCVEEVQYTLGSGRQALAYLIERDGFVFQSPITWYVRAKRWDIAPGYETNNSHLQRPVIARCLFCHVSRFENVPGTVNRYERPIFRGHAIGCERCHGPGELHVQRPAEVDGLDDTIVNPGALEPSLRDAVCEQCHLSGLKLVERLDRRDEDFRPGLPFQQFWIALSAAGTSENRFVNQVEQMHDSRCFRASQGRLGCISCHDPHRQPKPEEEVAYYKQRCLECHVNQGCSLPIAVRQARSRDDNCIACHMPRSRSSDVFHGTVTDHRVPRHAAGPEESPPIAPKPTSGAARMVLFHGDLMDEQERAAAGREIGVALARSYEWPESAAAAVPLLEAALSARSDDVTAWECKGVALARLGRHKESQVAFQTVLAKDPNRETALAEAADFADEAGRHDEAIALWRRAIAISPLRSEYHGKLALALFQARNWREAEKESRVAMRLSPADLRARELLVRCELRLKDRVAALKEFKALLEFDPPNRDDLIRRFAILAPAGGQKP